MTDSAQEPSLAELLLDPAGPPDSVWTAALEQATEQPQVDASDETDHLVPDDDVSDVPDVWSDDSFEDTHDVSQDPATHHHDEPWVPSGNDHDEPIDDSDH